MRLLSALGDAAVAQRFGHLGGEIVLDRLLVHIHQAADFFFTCATAQRFLERIPVRRFAREAGFGSTDILEDGKQIFAFVGIVRHQAMIDQID